MKLKTLRLAIGLALTTTAGISQAASFPIGDARVAGMGGVAVATANLDSAAYYNPALLASQDDSSDFSFATNLGVGIADPNNLTGAVDTFSNDLNTFSNTAYSTYLTDPATAQTNFNNLATSISNLGGKTYNLDVPVNLNLGLNFGGWAAAVTAQNFVSASVGIGAADGTPNLIDTRNNNSITSWSQIAGPGGDPTILQYLGTDARLEVNGVEGQVVGLSLARKLDVAGQSLSVGLTPKIVSISSAVGTADINSNTSSTPSLTIGNASSDFNLDAGVVWNISDSLRVAGTARNLIGKTYSNYEVKPQLRAGVGYATHLLTIGADMDLTENDAFGTKSRIVAVGAEFNAWSILQLRAGYRKDLSSSLTQVSYGVGLLNSAINIAVMANPQDMSQGVSAFVGFGLNF